MARRNGCKYVATRGTKGAAKKLAKELRRDGYRARTVKTDGQYRVMSCGRRR